MVHALPIHSSVSVLYWLPHNAMLHQPLPGHGGVDRRAGGLHRLGPRVAEVPEGSGGHAPSATASTSCSKGSRLVDSQCTRRILSQRFAYWFPLPLLIAFSWPAVILAQSGHACRHLPCASSSLDGPLASGPTASHETSRHCCRKLCPDSSCCARPACSARACRRRFSVRARRLLELHRLARFAQRSCQCFRESIRRQTHAHRAGKAKTRALPVRVMPDVAVSIVRSQSEQCVHSCVMSVYLPVLSVG